MLIGDVAYFLRGVRDLGLGEQGRPAFGLPAEFSLTRDDVRRTARRPSRAAARALSEEVVAELLDEPALGLIKQLFGQTTRRAVELLADTGRRPNEICILGVDCLDFDTQHDETGAEQKLGVLVHDMPKVARTGCRLPIDQATVELIRAQQRAVRARYPDTPAGELRLFPRLLRNPHGMIPISPAHVSRTMRLWVNALPALVDIDGSAFPRERVVAYAFRHSYAQRHSDNGTPVEVLRELMGTRAWSPPRATTATTRSSRSSTQQIASRCWRRSPPPAGCARSCASVSPTDTRASPARPVPRPIHGHRVRRGERAG